MAEATTTAIPDALHGPYAGLDLDALVDWPVVRAWLYWGMFWLMFAPTVGAYISGMFNFPDYLGGHLPLTFGRLRPVHVNGVIMGAFSGLFIGECYYLVPRLCGVRVAFNRYGVLVAWVWNLFLAAGLLSYRSATITVSRRVSCLCSPRFRSFSAPSSPPCSF